MRSNYDSLAAAVAQVLPILMIAVFIENRFISRRRDRFMSFYQHLALWSGWLGILGGFAYLAGDDRNPDSVSTRLLLVLWLVSTAMLAGSLAGNARQALKASTDRRNESDPSCGPSDQPDWRPTNVESRSVPHRLCSLLVLVLLWRRAGRR